MFLKLKIISLISDFLFRSCLCMLCSIFANFGKQPLGHFFFLKVEIFQALKVQYGKIIKLHQIIGSLFQTKIVKCMN